MDFTTPKAISQDIDKYDFVQLKNGNGYDHNWVLNTNGDINKLAAKLTSPVSGITLEVYTNEPGIQVYTGNFLVKMALFTTSVLLFVLKHSTTLTHQTSRNGHLLFSNRDRHTTVNASLNSV